MNRLSFSERVLLAIEKHNMLKAGNTILVAVSGGPDSVALLHFLFSIKDIYGLNLHVFHLNHRIRGSEADEDERFVAELASRLDVPVTLSCFDVPVFASSEGLSIEEAAREARYGLMESIVSDLGADKVALAHHADDQIETFLMRLIRGAGIDGLSAMKPVRDIYIRPFLDIGKEDILAYLKENKLTYRIDASNEDISITRNRVRHELVPLLVDFNPKFKSSALKAIEITNEDHRYLKRVTEELFQEIADISESDVSFGINDLLQQPPAIGRRLIRRAIAEVKGDLYGVEFKHIHAVIDGLVNKPLRFAIDIPGDIVVFTEYNRLLIVRRGNLAKPFVEPAFKPQLLKVPGVTIVEELGIEISAELIDPKDIEFGRNGEIAHLDVDKIRGSIHIRARRPGDSFRPFGLGGEKKLQDFFVDAKVARRKRDRIPIIVAGEDIIWVAGFRIDDRFRVTSDTRRVLVLTIMRMMPQSYG